MLKRLFRLSGVGVLAALYAAVSCGGGSELLDNDRRGGNGTDIDGSTGQGDSGNLGSPGPDGSFNVDGGSSNIDEDACAGRTLSAERLPLDLFFMVDISGSMVNANTAAGITKWEAVKRALEAFFEDEASAGISVGMQYFPILQNCTSRAQCSEGICFGGTCSGPGPVGFCGSSLDCPRGGACNALGECSAINAYCDPRSAGADCGQCTPLEPMCATVTFEGQTVSTLYHGSCEVSGYANPVVPIAPLPGAAQDLVSSLASADPLGGTPMAPALTGAIELARQHAGANPSHTVATVLATDGFPSECIAGNVADGLPEVRNIATSGTQGDNPIRTFVVGVFGPEDYTQLQTTPAILTARMDELAAAGGTDKSFIVSTDQDVTAKFIEALNVIRQSALGCNFEIPQPAEGELDYFQVNVQVTNQAGVRNRLFYVGSAAGCATVAEGGWYYDVDPESGQTPTTIIACDQNCAELQRGTIRQVDIELGCQTIEPIVR